MIKITVTSKRHVCTLMSPPLHLTTIAVCKAKMDLAILIDGSQSVEYFAKGNFQRCLQFIKKLVSGFNIAKEGTHVGIVIYSRDAKVIFGFEKYFNLWTMLTAIESIQYPQNGTNTGRALDVVRTQLFDASARQGVPNILLIMTNGASQVSIWHSKCKTDTGHIDTSVTPKISSCCRHGKSNAVTRTRVVANANFDFLLWSLLIVSIVVHFYPLFNFKFSK